MYLQTYDDTPFVSVLLATHSGDVHLLHRSLGSLYRQLLDPERLEVLIAFDGEPTEEEMATIESASANAPFHVRLFWDPVKTGYYCVPRNQAFVHARGHYIANLDADNEFAPEHLVSLLDVLRRPAADAGFQHFAYSRRLYVRDEGSDPKLPVGPSALVPWNTETIRKMESSPKFNFVDTGDYLIGRSALYRLAEMTGMVWNNDYRRFGDWEMNIRIARCGMRGIALPDCTHVYHWTGKNLQTSRPISDLVVIPEEVYNRMRDKGQIV